MIPASFQYLRPSRLDDAIRALQQDPEAKCIAGGHSLLPLMKLRLARPSLLVDIGRLPELQRMDQVDGYLVLGAGLRYIDVLRHGLAVRVCPLLGEAIGVIADPQVRSRGTIGGSAAHADPTADLAAAFLALDAEFVVQGAQGERRIAADDWYVAPLVTAMAAHEILVRIEVPLVSGAGTYLKFPHPASGYALAGVAGLVRRQDDGQVEMARLAITGAAAMPFRARSAEHYLTGRRLDTDSIRAAAELGAADGEYEGDAQYGAEYRQNLARVMMVRGLERLRVE